MRDHELYSKILGIESPWKVVGVDLDMEAGEVRVNVEFVGTPSCTECGKRCPGYDSRVREWRHLDTCQLQTFIRAEVPRVECDEHGVRQVRTPWAEPGSRFTAMFERVVIDWLREASFAAVARRLRLTWDQVDGIQSRAVRRGLARREKQFPVRLGIDETSYRKRHTYVTVVTDLDRSVVLDVIQERTRESLSSFYRGLDDEQRSSIRSVSMDMWAGYINSTLEHIPDAERKICFDRFHVMQHLSRAIDEVRKREHRDLRSRGDDRLKRTKYLWLQNPRHMSKARLARFESIRSRSLRTSRAWAMVEASRSLWGYTRRAWAERAWRQLLGWMSRSRLPAMVRASKTLRRHLWGILNAVVHGTTNAGAESMNSKIQRLKRMACGYRNRTRFRNAILFHLGGLDLYPAHTKA
ncbi:MAG: ISL3 family transposase [Phycisphaerales bacterium]|nr:ISL3 family transposase [Phycisphaerales bacterium]